LIALEATVEYLPEFLKLSVFLQEEKINTNAAKMERTSVVWFFAFMDI
jgi:hypothetical protein